ncbi:hypothetical protein O0L34_g16444 [Tuta absoluta]|nr:hypothetical protein O0L34_g16444 [Tuta absoluta]
MWGAPRAVAAVHSGSTSAASEAVVSRRLRPGEAGGPAPRPAAHLPAASAQSTATRRLGDLCSVHAATFSTLSRALRDVSRFSRTLSFPLPRGLPRTSALATQLFAAPKLCLRIFVNSELHRSRWKTTARVAVGRQWSAVDAVVRDEC